MREIKFKVIFMGRINKNAGWHGDCYADFDGTITLPDEENCIYLEYIGVKDSKGVELYEGDIIDSYGKITRIEDIFLAGYMMHECTLMDGEFTIIGNIYENPELLNS